MALALTATVLGDKRVQLAATGVSTNPVALDSPTITQLAASTASSGTTLSDQTTAVLMTTTLSASVTSGRLSRSVVTTSATGNVREVFQVMTSSTAAKVRVWANAQTAGPYQDVTPTWSWVRSQWAAWSSPQVYGLELFPTSPFQSSVDVLVRSFRIRSGFRGDPKITRSDGYVVPLDLDSIVTGMETGAFTVYDNSAPVGTALTYTLTDTVVPSPTTATSGSVTVTSAGPIITNPDTQAAGVVVDAVTAYTAGVTPQQSVEPVVAADAPLLVPSAGSLRAGQLTALCLTYPVALQLSQLLAAGGRVRLRHPGTFPGMDMVCAVDGTATMAPAPAGEGMPTPPWLVTIPYREMTP